MAKPDITDHDLYAILEIESTATAQEVIKIVFVEFKFK